jgi:hydroxypyruvate reductase
VVKIDRAFCEAGMRAAIAACDPERLVRERIRRARVRGDAIYGLAIGKAAQAMARGAGPVKRGVCVTHALDGKSLPTGWYAIESSHPIPDARSLAAGDAVCDLVASAGPKDRLLALISGGASSLVERPIAGLSLEQFVREVQAIAASGATIQTLNAARTERSQLKGGKLADVCVAPITTLVASDVVDDDPYVVGSGPTCSRRRPDDSCEVVIPIRAFAIAFGEALKRDNVDFGMLDAPLASSVEECRDILRIQRGDGPVIAWGEPTIVLPPHHGKGGRAQQLALEIARELRGGWQIAFVVGSDGMDGPAPRGRPAPAGAYVDGTTWAAIKAAGVDPVRAIERCDAGTALAAVDALVVTGPTGINHGDLVLMT